MEEIKLNFINYKKLKHSESLIPNKKIYIRDNDLYKIYTFNTKSRFSIIDTEIPIDRTQIEYLSSMQKYIKKSHLPRGIISYKENDLGVIYNYFKGYKSFENLHLEDKNVMFNNIKSAIIAMNELICFNIYNTDLISQNILYKDNKVELIDLDGPYISCSNSKLKYMYRNFLNSLINILENKLSTKYDKKEVLLILKEIRIILGLNKVFIEKIETSQIDKIESLKLI